MNKKSSVCIIPLSKLCASPKINTLIQFTNSRGKCLLGSTFCKKWTMTRDRERVESVPWLLFPNTWSIHLLLHNLLWGQAVYAFPALPAGLEVP